MGRTAGDPAAQLCLPPGFRFFPTDEELVVHYLCRKAAGQQFSLDIIGDIDLYKFDPWLLPGKALFGEKEWYFFSPRDRKYPNGLRPNRVAGSGYWKATGTDKIITVDGRKVGIKKALVFYTGKAPKGIKTNWIMHEYRLAEKSSKTAKKKGSLRLDDWVLCRIYEKNSSTQKTIRAKESAADDASCFDEVLASLPEIDDRFFTLPRISSLKSLPTENLNVQNLSPVKIDWSEWKDQQQPQQQQNQNQYQHQQPQQQYSNRTTDPDLGAVTEIGSRGMRSNVYYSGIPPLFQMESPADKAGSLTEEEVQSGLRQQQLDNQMFGQSFSQFLQPYVVSNPNPNLAGIGSFRGDGKFRM